MKQQLRVRHIPPGQEVPFYVYGLKDVEAAARLIRTLAQYDIYLYDRDVLPKLGSRFGLEFLDVTRNKWSEWYDDGRCDIKAYISHTESLRDDCPRIGTHYRTDKTSQTEGLWNAITACGMHKVEGRFVTPYWTEVTCPACLSNLVLVRD